MVLGPLYGVMAEIVLDQAIRDYRIRRLQQEIDAALAEHNRARFMALTEELRALLSMDA
ncbi:MAG: IDEAL domain-containing protein [Hydrogenibacillus sp.]|nr:IDEAL domain-containing protein [Hydrogenibacillus sp.]